MKYEYNSGLGCFERSDGLGKKIWVNMSEAQRIITLRDLGNTIGEIQAKMNFTSNKATSYSVKTILNKYDDGSIIIDMSSPASNIQFEDMSMDARIMDLEERLSKLEKLVTDKKEESFTDKVKSWMR